MDFAEPTDHRPCPICGNANFEPLHEQRFFLPEDYPLANRYTVVSCRTCGFVFADTVVDQAKFDAFYANLSKYEDDAAGTGGGGTAWDQNRLRETALGINRVVNRSARVLDIGCANGGLLVELRKLGFERLAGLDPSQACVRRAAALGFEAAQGCLPAIPVSLGTFDCIILSHVLEHLFNVRSAVEALGHLLSPGGIVYAEVPDAARYHEFLAAPFQDFNTEHINHFSARCLNNLLGNSGYRRIGGGHKEIASSSDSLTPVIFGFYRASGGEYKLVPDRLLRERILLYIAGSSKFMDEINAKLQKALPGNAQLIIWGTGQLTMKLLCESILADREVVAFVDNNPINQGRILRGVRVLSPRQLVESGLRQPIVIGSLLHGREIIDGIRANYQLDNQLVELAAGSREGLRLDIAPQKNPR